MAKERGLQREREEMQRAARLVEYMESRGIMPSAALSALANASSVAQRPAARRRMLRNEGGSRPRGGWTWTVGGPDCGVEGGLRSHGAG